MRSSAEGRGLTSERRSHSVDAAIAPGDLLPVDVIEERGHVFLAPRVVLGPGMLRHVAYQQRIGADPDATEIAVHDDVVPTVVVRIVDKRCPASCSEGTGREVRPPARERTHVLGHVPLDVARDCNRLRCETAEVELVQEDRVRRRHLLLPKRTVRGQTRRAAIGLCQAGVRDSERVDGLHVYVVVRGKLRLSEETRQLGMGQRGRGPRLEAGLARQQALARETCLPRRVGSLSGCRPQAPAGRRSRSDGEPSKYTATRYSGPLLRLYVLVHSIAPSCPRSHFFGVSSAALIPRASSSAGPFAQKWRNMIRGSSCVMWLWIATMLMFA